MKAEVATAVNFITTLLKGTGLLSEEQLQHFSHSLEGALGGEIKHVITQLWIREKSISMNLCLIEFILHFSLKCAEAFWFKNETQMNNACSVNPHVFTNPLLWHDERGKLITMILIIITGVLKMISFTALSIVAYTV